MGEEKKYQISSFGWFHGGCLLDVFAAAFPTLAESVALRISQ